MVNKLKCVYFSLHARDYDTAVVSLDAIYLSMVKLYISRLRLRIFFQLDTLQVISSLDYVCLLKIFDTFLLYL